MSERKTGNRIAWIVVASALGAIGSVLVLALSYPSIEYLDELLLTSLVYIAIGIVALSYAILKDISVHLEEI